MEVEEPGVRKPGKGRRSRSNSIGTKEIKADKSSSRETNGDTGHKLQFSNSSDLPNGDEPPERVKGNSDKLNDNVADLDTESSAVESNRRPPSKHEVNANMCNSSPEHATDDQRAELNYSQKMARDGPPTDDEEQEDCMGWSDSDDRSKNESSVIARVIEKYEGDGPLSDDEQSEEDGDPGASPGKLEGVSPGEAFADEACSSGASSPSLSGYPSEGKTRGPGKRVHVDLSNPLYRKPLDMGWKRELVYRNTSDPTHKRMADIYYYTPTGKKVRSAREVSEHLYGDELTDENFTFFKRPLGINDPTKEIIRDAKRGALRESSGTPPHKVQKLMKPKAEGSQKSGSDKEDSVGVKTPKNFSRGSFPRIRMNRMGPGSGSSGSKPLGRPRKDAAILGPVPADGELEMGLLPPSWKEATAVSPGPGAASASSWAAAGAAKDENGALLGLARATPGGAVPGTSGGLFLHNFMQSLSEGYWALHHVFQYLKVHELLRASRVCRMWRDLASHPTLWRTVRMKNSQVLDWDGCMEALRRHGTRHLDLRKMLLVDSGRGGSGAAGAASAAEAWERFCGAVDRVPTLEHLDLCRCPPWVVERIAQRCPQLTHLVATLLQDQPLQLDKLSVMQQLQELRLKGSSRLVLKGSLQSLTELRQLTHLSLTSVKSLGSGSPQLLQELTQLESLELGECSDLPEEFGTVCLPRLVHLHHLRLEMGQEQCPTFGILEGVSKLPDLTELELLNFDIKPGFDKALAQCTNIQHLLLIPTYLSQSATTNHMVLGGVLQLEDSLRTLVWGITHELLQVTELFIYQCEEQKSSGEGPGAGGVHSLQQPFLAKKTTGGDSIPVLKPVPGRTPSRTEEEKGKSYTDPKVDIMPIPHLWKLLTAKLPNTDARILKIPYSATLRQSLGDHVQRSGDARASGP